MYWDCDCGRKHISGEKQICEGCGKPIQNETQFYMNEEDKKNPVFINYKIEKRPNWFCDYCNCQNLYSAMKCYHCGGERSNEFYNTEESTFNRQQDKEKEQNFSADTVITSSEKEMSLTASTHPVHSTEGVWVCDACNNSNNLSVNVCKYCGCYKEENKSELVSQFAISSNSVIKASKNNIISKTLKILVVALMVFGCVFGISKLVQYNSEEFPITREVISMSWQSEVDVSRYTECSESGWKLPSNANLIRTSEEIRSYKKVFDHTETKTKKVPYKEKVFDGYSYKDLGNGYAEKVKKYKTVTKYKTETYTENVYRQEPVYDTKYYYTVWKWKPYTTLHSSGTTKDVVCPDTSDYKEKEEYRCSSPKTTYSINFREVCEALEKEREYTKTFDYSIWEKYDTGQITENKSTRGKINLW